MDILREIIKDPIHSQIIHQLALLYVIILKVNCRGHKLLSSFLYIIVSKNKLLFEKCSSIIGLYSSSFTFRNSSTKYSLRDTWKWTDNRQEN